VSLVSSGAGPRSGREASFGIEESAGCILVTLGCGEQPKRRKATHPRSRRFIISLLDEVILRKLPYEKLTER
jgi:hypothetical protein